MNLQEELIRKRKELASQYPEQTKKTLRQILEDFKRAEILRHSLKVGDIAPDFVLERKNIAAEPPKKKKSKPQPESVSLNELIKDQSLVLVFYQGGWSPFCNIQLQALNEAYSKVKALGGELIALSPESRQQTLQTVNQNQLNFRVYADINNEMAKLFKIMFKYPLYALQVFDNHGLDLPDSTQTNTLELPAPATFVINRSKKITYASLSEDFTQRAPLWEVMEAVYAF